MEERHGLYFTWGAGWNLSSPATNKWISGKNKKAQKRRAVFWKGLSGKE